MEIDISSESCYVQVTQYRRGKTKVLNFFMGQVQKKLDGRADGKAASAILQRRLSSDVHSDWQFHN